MHFVAKQPLLSAPLRNPPMPDLTTLRTLEHARLLSLLDYNQAGYFSTAEAASAAYTAASREAYGEFAEIL